MNRQTFSGDEPAKVFSIWAADMANTKQTDSTESNRQRINREVERITGKLSSSRESKMRLQLFRQQYSSLSDREKKIVHIYAWFFDKRYVWGDDLWLH